MNSGVQFNHDLKESEEKVLKRAREDGLAPELEEDFKKAFENGFKKGYKEGYKAEQDIQCLMQYVEKKQQSIKQKEAETINQTINSLRGKEISDEDIKQLIVDSYHLTEEDVDKYLND